MLELIVRDREVKGKKEKKKKTHFISGFLRSTRCPRSTLFTTYSIPLTFTSPGEFCSFTLAKGWLLFCCCFNFFPVCVCCVCVCGGGGVSVFVEYPQQHTNTPHSPGRRTQRKKTRVFMDFNRVLFKGPAFFSFLLMLFPLISADQNPS